MERFWSLLFLSVPVMGVVIVLGAALGTGMSNVWLPESIGPRTQGVDFLFNMISVLLGVVFAGTGLTLAYSLFRFRSGATDQASSTSHNTVLEVLWTVVPAGILVFLAMYQLPYWKENKVNHPLANVRADDEDFQPPFARVVAFQYGWRFIYPGDDNVFDTPDDLILENEFVVPTNKDILIELVSEDVIHSFAINPLRLKQDIVPGLTPRIWFEVTQVGEWEINCMELCGWGHFRMGARFRSIEAHKFPAWVRENYLERGY